MIEKISIKNFKNHADTTIELYQVPASAVLSETSASTKLGKVTALVGPNGAGKSTVLETIYEFNRIVERLVIQGQWSSDSLLALVRRNQYEWGICVTGRKYEETKWQIQINKTSSALEPQWIYKLNEGAINGNDPDATSARKMVADMFGRAVYFKAIAQSSSLPSYIPDVRPKIRNDGSGLATVISDLKGHQEEIANRIEDDLKKIVPLVKRIRVHPVYKSIKEKRTLSANGNTIAYDEDRQVIAQELIFDTESGDGLPASLMSEGTLVTLALLTLLHTSDASLFLLDDIEQGLHPLAQRRLMQALKDFANQHNRQIILTTHSPYIVDELNAENVWVMTTDEAGISHCQQLSKGPNAEFALKVLTTGEFLDAEGEDWVLDSPAQKEPAHA